jgi:hypothetical protein
MRHVVFRASMQRCLLVAAVMCVSSSLAFRTTVFEVRCGHLLSCAMGHFKRLLRPALALDGTVTPQPPPQQHLTAATASAVPATATHTCTQARDQLTLLRSAHTLAL